MFLFHFFLIMLYHKTFCIALFACKKTFVINVNFFVSIMRFCKNCVASHQSCQINNTSKKCMKCNAFDRFCDLYVFFVVIQRLHRERIKLKKQIRDVQAIVTRKNKKLICLKQ